jgi:toxin ParE1/3/4
MGQLFITRGAEADLLDIWSYVAEDNVETADILLDRIYEKCRSLVEAPSLGRRREDLAPGLRSLPVGSYLIFYRTVEDGLQIIRVLHGSRDIDDAFFP